MSLPMCWGIPRSLLVEAVLWLTGHLCWAWSLLYLWGLERMLERLSWKWVVGLPPKLGRRMLTTLFIYNSLCEGSGGLSSFRFCGGHRFSFYNTISISCGLELSMLPEGCEVCPWWLYNRARSWTKHPNHSLRVILVKTCIVSELLCCLNQEHKLLQISTIGCHHVW